MRECWALVKCGKGCSYVSGVFDPSTLLLLEINFLSEISKMRCWQIMLWGIVGLSRKAQKIAQMLQPPVLLFYRTLFFANHQKDNRLYVCAACWHQQNRVWTTTCFEILRLATFGLPSCKTLIFGSPTLKNKTTCLDVGVRAVLWVKAQYVV